MGRNPAPWVCPASLIREPPSFCNLLKNSPLSLPARGAVFLGMGFAFCRSMMRIAVVAQSEARVVLKVDGWIAGEGVAVLATEGGRWLRGGRRLVLTLEGVDFIDEAGIALLEGWPTDMLELRGASVYLRMLLERHGLDQSTDSADDHSASEGD